MATFLDVDLVKYLCSCGKKRPVCRLYLCRHCLKLRCGDCVLHEVRKLVDTPYCPNCLENMPSAEAKLKKNRCSNCFDCPSCSHTLATRATSQMVSNPEDPNKSTPKKMYYMACGFCRWTTRDVNIADKSVGKFYVSSNSSGGWEDLENPDAKRIFSLLEQYQQIAQKEKAEKERKKYVRRRSYMTYAASIDKYGLTSVAAKRKSLSTNVSNISLKENEEAVITQLKPAEPTGEFEPLPEDVFTQPLLLDKISTISQRHATPEFQPSETTSMYPVHKHLLIRRSLRCKECEHNLCKPEFNPISIKFKIQLVALLHIPEIRIFAPTDLVFKKETKVILTVCNPAAYNTTIELKKMDPESDDFSNSKAELPKKEIILSRRDDAAIYDDGSQGQEAFKDDHNIVPFRKANKIGVIVKVTPQVQKENVKISFILRHDHRNTTISLPSENQEPQIVWLEHKVFIDLGPVKQK
ncbi:hypothetical protein KUTeg_004188 [Tegillarca granosa]|uniref:Dynactin subunit 4 n=1 Tax=Tegillarca granosa TaxID=220873 RepID=A0ABQ9FR17_TEGGR|nr:hypothetical protein KUTeg_004188 [Tegillarca granosa]